MHDCASLTNIAASFRQELSVKQSKRVNRHNKCNMILVNYIIGLFELSKLSTLSNFYAVFLLLFWIGLKRDVGVNG